MLEKLAELMSLAAAASGNKKRSAGEVLLEVEKEMLSKDRAVTIGELEAYGLSVAQALVSLERYPLFREPDLEARLRALIGRIEKSVNEKMAQDSEKLPVLLLDNMNEIRVGETGEASLNYRAFEVGGVAVKDIATVRITEKTATAFRDKTMQGILFGVVKAMKDGNATWVDDSTGKEFIDITGSWEEICRLFGFHGKRERAIMYKAITGDVRSREDMELMADDSSGALATIKKFSAGEYLELYIREREVFDPKSKKKRKDKAFILKIPFIQLMGVKYSDKWGNRLQNLSAGEAEKVKDGKVIDTITLRFSAFPFQAMKDARGTLGNIGGIPYDLNNKVRKIIERMNMESGSKVYFTSQMVPVLCELFRRVRMAELNHESARNPDTTPSIPPIPWSDFQDMGAAKRDRAKRKEKHAKDIEILARLLIGLQGLDAVTLKNWHVGYNEQAILLDPSDEYIQKCREKRVIGKVAQKEARKAVSQHSQKTRKKKT